MEGKDIKGKSFLRTDYTLRLLKSDELPVVCSWAYKEDWPVSEHTVQCAYDTDSGGAFAAVSSSGDLIGCIHALNYSTVCVVGMFIVVPQWRRKGIGQALLEQAVLYSDKRNVLLNSIDTRINYYAARHFSIVDIPIISYVGTMDKKSLPVGQINDNIKVVLCNSTTILQMLIGYDAIIVGMSRERYLQKWINTNLTNTYVAVKKGNKEEIVGYCCTQKVGSQVNIHQIGPLYSNEAGIAKLLLAEVINNHVQPGEEITMEIPKNVPFNIGEEYNLTPSLPMHRMYSKETIYIDYSRIYGLTNTESAFA